MTYSYTKSFLSTCVSGFLGELIGYLLLFFTSRSLERYKSWRRDLDTAGDRSSSALSQDTLPTSADNPASTTITTMPGHAVSDMD